MFLGSVGGFAVVLSWLLSRLLRGLRAEQRGSVEIVNALPLDEVGVLEALRSIVIPGLEADPVTLGLVRGVSVEGDSVTVYMVRPRLVGRGVCMLAGELLWRRIERDITRLLEKLGFRDARIVYA